jgi:hypothetical protein
VTPAPFIPDTNPLERVNREIARRTDVVGIFPDDAALIRLVSMLAIEANDEWLVGRSYISQKSMATLSDPVSEKDLSRSRQRGRAHRGLIRRPLHDERERRVLHHIPGLDSSRWGSARRSACWGPRLLVRVLRRSQLPSESLYPAFAFARLTCSTAPRGGDRA